MANYSVHLDTDIGDDIDDAFCLALLLASPEIALKSVSTVFLYTDRRCDMVREMCEVARQSPQIGAGMRGVLSPLGIGRWATRALTHYPSKTLDHAEPERAFLPLMQTARQTCDAILTIGPMTNLAASLAAQPDVSRFPRVCAMAGEFQIGGRKEHNIMVDPEAAALCCTSGVTIDFIPWSIGPAVKLQPADIDRLRAATSPLSKLLLKWLEEFWTHVPGKTNMYDPMTVVALLRPDLFEWHRGVVSVELRGEQTYGMTMFRRDDAGPHRVAMGVKADEARAFLVDRICQ
jgi:inosine-uridine nucleoside N-ribohydrolase